LTRDAATESDDAEDPGIRTPRPARRPFKKKPAFTDERGLC